MNSGIYPYSVGIASKNISHDMDASSQINKYKEDESQQKAPPTLPYEFDNVTKVLGDTFTSLTELRNILSRASHNDSISKDNVEVIKQKIDKINELILELPQDLAIISL